MTRLCNWIMNMLERFIKLPSRFTSAPLRFTPAFRLHLKAISACRQSTWPDRFWSWQAATINWFALEAPDCRLPLCMNRPIRPIGPDAQRARSGQCNSIIHQLCYKKFSMLKCAKGKQILTCNSTSGLVGTELCAVQAQIFMSLQFVVRGFQNFHLQFYFI